MTTDSPDALTQRLHTHDDALTHAERRVARFIDRNRAVALASSAAEMASLIGTSDATVVRAVQALGFAGLGELRRTLVPSVTHAPATPADNMRRTLGEVGADTARAIGLVLDTHAETLAALADATVRGQIVTAVSALHPAHRIVVFGIGPSAALASYAAMLLERSGRPSKCLNATGIMLADQLLDLRADDAILALAYGRAYREVTTVFAEARRLRLPIVLVTDATDGRLAKAASVVLAARRGRSDRVALHGTTLIALEALILGLSAADREAALRALDRLNTLRAAVGGRATDIG